MKAKKIFTLLAAPLLLGAVASCGDKPTVETPTTDNPVTTTTPNTEPTDGKILGTADKHISITFAHTMGKTLQDLLKGYIETFKEIQPYVDVEEKNGGTNYSVLKDAVVTQIGAGNAPDIVEAYSDHVAEYLNYNYVQDVTSFMKTYPLDNEADYIGLAAGKEYSTAGMYSLPFKNSTEQMIYNKALLGIDLTGIDATINDGKALSEVYLSNLTWEDLFEHLAPALKAYNKTLSADKKLYNEEGCVVGYDSDDNIFITLAKQYGYKYTSIDEFGEASIDFNTAEMKALVKKFSGYAKDKLLTTKGLLGGSTYTSTYFTEKKSLFTISSSAGVGYCYNDKAPFTSAVVGLPQAAGKQQYVISQGSPVAILRNNNDKSQEAEDRALATYFFYRHLTNTENATDWATRGSYNPIRNSTFDDETYQETKVDLSTKSEPSKDYLLTSSVKQLAQYNTNGGWYFTSPSFKGSAVARVQVGGIITAAFTEATKGTLTDTKLDEIFNNAYANTVKAL